MMRSYEGIFSEPILDAQIEIGGPGDPENWRYRRPTLILDTRTHLVRPPGRLVTRLASQVSELWELTEAWEDQTLKTMPIKRELAANIVQVFDDSGCDVVFWPMQDSPIDAPPRKEDYFKQLESFTGVSFIDLEEITLAQRAAFAMPVYDEPSFWRFVKAYSQASPEIWPSINTRKKEIGLRDSAPSSYINVLLRQVEENDGIPELLEPAKIQGMNWVDSAHYGSWKVAQVFWFINSEGRPEFKRIILGTLEGSHPQFGSEGNIQYSGSLADVASEIGRRFMIFGAVKEVKTEHETDNEKLAISAEKWANLQSIKSLIKTGAFLGERGLISGEVKLEEMVQSRALRRILPSLAQWSQQAESARCLWEPEIDELVVTVTGKLGGSKTKMDPKDLVAVRPKPNTKNDLLLRPIGADKPPKPSVEAREFAIPLYRMAEEIPDFSFRVKRNGDGSYTPDKNGDYNMWRIVGVDHLHRDVKIDKLNPDKIIVVEPDSLDAVGCGVDANDEKSEYALRQAFAQGQQFSEEKGYWPSAAVFYVPNHGWNAILFAHEDENGNIGSDLGKGFRDAIENRDLVYGTFAEGVTQV